MRVSSTPLVPGDDITCMETNSTRMLDQFDLAIAVTPERLKPQNAQHQDISSRRILQVYQRCAKMPKALLSIAEPTLDSRIHRTESLVGKYDSAVLIDANLSDPVEFPSSIGRHIWSITTYQAVAQPTECDQSTGASSNRP